MSLLFRYIFLSVALASAMGVAFFAFVLMTGNVIRDIVGELASGRLSFTMAAELLLLLAPYTISFALPLGSLIGVLVVLGRLSARQEITAMRAAGISLWRISAPVFLVAVIGCVAASFINNHYAPIAKERYKSMLEDLVREDPMRFIVARSFIKDFPGYVFYVGEKNGDRLERFWMWELDAEKRVVAMLRAREGRIEFDADSDTLLLSLVGVSGEIRSERTPDDPRSGLLTGATDDVRFRLPLASILGTGSDRGLDTGRLGIRALLAHRKLLQEQISDPTVGDDAVFAAQADLSRIDYGISRNFAMAFSIVALTFLGIPLGIRASRSETHANLGLALALAMVYYLMLIVVDWQDGIPERRAEILVWLPNMIYVALGATLLRTQRKR